MIEITDTTTGHTEAMETYNVVDTLIPNWYPEAPEDVTNAIENLQDALTRGEPTEGFEQYLAISINRTPTA